MATRRADWKMISSATYEFWDGTVIAYCPCKEGAWKVLWPRGISEWLAGHKKLEAMYHVEAGIPKNPIFQPFGAFKRPVEIGDAAEVVRHHRSCAKRPEEEPVIRFSNGSTIALKRDPHEEEMAALRGLDTLDTLCFGEDEDLERLG